MTALTDKLAALAAEDEVFVAGARVIAQDGGPVALAAILREIDDTVLERTLGFSIGDVTVSLIVAGRRLKGMVEVSDNAPNAATVIGKSLTREEPQVLQAAGAFMAQICATATRVTVRALPVQRFGNSGDVGISAAGLADLWQVDLNAKPSPPMTRFLAANAASFSAKLYLTNGIVTEMVGNAAPLQTIWETQFSAFRQRQNTVTGKPADSQLMCFDGALGPGTAVAIAMTGDDVCLCAFAPEALATLTASWQAIAG
jgi:hypothetical protein